MSTHHHFLSSGAMRPVFVDGIYVQIFNTFKSEQLEIGLLIYSPLKIQEKDVDKSFGDTRSKDPKLL